MLDTISSKLTGEILVIFGGGVVGIKDAKLGVLE